PGVDEQLDGRCRPARQKMVLPRPWLERRVSGNRRLGKIVGGPSRSGKPGARILRLRAPNVPTGPAEERPAWNQQHAPCGAATFVSALDFSRAGVLAALLHARLSHNSGPPTATQWLGDPRPAFGRRVGGSASLPV